MESPIKTIKMTMIASPKRPILRDWEMSKMTVGL